MKTHLLLILLLHIHIIISAGLASSGLDLPREAEAGDMVGLAEEELELDSEVSRRVLMMQKRYISYETLRRDAVPCLTPGASYYNCGPAEANRYSRGCEVITRCARSIGH